MLVKNMKNAFSLIEILVVVAIIAILTSIIIFSMNGAKNVREVESAALITSSRIREMQTAALTGKQHLANTTPCAYRVTWGSTDVTGSYVYKDGAGSCNQSAAIASTVLPSGVTFSATGSVDFVLPHAKISAAQTLTMQKGSASKAICIQSNGRVEIKASAGSC